MISTQQEALLFPFCFFFWWKKLQKHAIFFRNINEHVFSKSPPTSDAQKNKNPLQGPIYLRKTKIKKRYLFVFLVTWNNCLTLAWQPNRSCVYEKPTKLLAAENPEKVKKKLKNAHKRDPAVFLIYLKKKAKKCKFEKPLIKKRKKNVFFNFAKNEPFLLGHKPFPPLKIIYVLTG